MKRLIIAAGGLALVGGIIIGGMVGNPFGRSSAANAQTDTPTPYVAGTATAAALTATAAASSTTPTPNATGIAATETAQVPTKTPTNTPVPVGSGCYTNWNDATCATGWTAVSTGVWTVLGTASSVTFGTLICAQAKAENNAFELSVVSDTRNNPSGSHTVQDEPCAICCGIAAAAGSPSVVGGVAESPDLATRTGGMGGGTYAVLGAVGGVLAITVAGTVVKRRGGQ
ncbi:MAG: hypothetical protein ABSC13_08345 [Dehalococcoidia bacterium]|jgi:MFS family permease